jgi:hypothetical protein
MPAFTFNEFLNKSVTIKSRAWTTFADGGLSQSPTTLISNVSVQLMPFNGASNEDMLGKPVQDCDFYAISDVALDVSNGDLIVDEDGVKYEVKYFEHPESFIGEYFIVYLKTIRE